MDTFTQKIITTQDTQISHLLSPDPSEVILSDFPISKSFSLSTLRLSPLSTPQPRLIQQAAPRSNKISASLDTNNILSERVNRSKHFSQKDAYVISLEQVVKSSINTFYAAFSAYITASIYYNKEQKPLSTVTNTDPSVPYLYQDTLPPEPHFYRQMLKHPHAQGFLQAI